MRTIVFDMYGVIIKESKGNFIPYTYSHFPNTNISFLVTQFTDAGLGKIDSDELLKSLSFSDCSFHMRDYIENHLTIDSGFYAFAEKYQKAYEFVLLSNDVLAWNRYILEYYDIKKYFKHCIVSAEVHTRKPEKAIYEIALSRIGGPANECVFIDNSVKNLDVASEIGMNTVLFNRDGEIYDKNIVYSFQELDDMLINTSNC